ncbi:helix-turn-helix domain-containing protein [Streptomyces sp. NBC_01614]|uniref:helix-turn-helix domain-containing protein n=1 Tax=Streptomyces sp. NBC_01614 TaxID=2975897 RepID=UPI003863A3F3
MEIWSDLDDIELDKLLDYCRTGQVPATVKDVAPLYGMSEDALMHWLESMFLHSKHLAVKRASAGVATTEVDGWDKDAWSEWLQTVCIQADYLMAANPPGFVSAPQQQIQGAGYVWTPDPAPQPAPAAPPPVHSHPATHAWSQMDENVLIHWLDWLALMDQPPTWDTIADGLAAFLASEDIHDDPTAWWTTAWQSPDGQIAYLRQYQSRKADLSALDAQIAYAWQSTQWTLANQQQQTQNQPQPPTYTWTPDQQPQHYPQQPAYTWVPDQPQGQQHYPRTTPQTHPPAQNPQTHPRNQPAPHPATQSSSGQPTPRKRKQPGPDPNFAKRKNNQGIRKRHRPVGDNAFSQKMLELREEAGLSQQKFAERGDVTKHFIVKGESGGYIDPDTARRWIQAVTSDPKIREELQALYDAIFHGREDSREDGGDAALLAFRVRMLQLRADRGFSQAEVAAAVGVGNGRISDWEIGAATPSVGSDEKVNRWINFLTAGLQDRESVRRELRQLYEGAKTVGTMTLWTD